MNDIAEIVRAIGRQQGQNACYRQCYNHMKYLQDLVIEASNQPLCLYHASNPFLSPDETERPFGIALTLRNATQELLYKIQMAESNWEEFCLDSGMRFSDDRKHKSSGLFMVR